MAGLWRVWLALGALAIIIGLALFAEGGGGRLGSPAPASVLADGPPDSPDECRLADKVESDGSVEESGSLTGENVIRADGDVVTLTSPEGQIIGGVCIHAGRFHSGLITEDTNISLDGTDCYRVEFGEDRGREGVDRTLVIVQKTVDGPTCPDLSHIDVWLVTLGSITVVKFQDADNDGERDGEEQLLSGWTINLYRGDNCDDEENFLTSAVTDGDGQVVFADLLPGQYSVSEEQRTGWQQTAPRNESGVLECFNFTLSSGQSLEVRFGNAEVVTGGGGNGGSGGTGGDGGNGGDGGDGGTGGTGGGGQQDGQQGGQQQEGQQDSQQQQQQGGQQQVQQVGAVQLPRGGAGQALTSGRFPASLQAVAGLALVAAGLALLVGTPILARRRGR